MMLKWEIACLTWARAPLEVENPLPSSPTVNIMARERDQGCELANTRGHDFDVFPGHATSSCLPCGKKYALR